MKYKVILIFIFSLFFCNSLLAQNEDFDLEDYWDMIRKEGKVAMQNNKFCFTVSNLFIVEEDMNIPRDILDLYICYNYTYKDEHVFGYLTKVYKTMSFIIRPDVLNLNWEKYKEFISHKYSQDEHNIIKKYIKSNNFSKEFKDAKDIILFSSKFGDEGVAEMKRNIHYIVPLIKTWNDLAIYQENIGKYRLELFDKYFISIVNKLSDISIFNRYFKNSEELSRNKYIEFYEKDAIIIGNAINYLYNNLPQKVNTSGDLISFLEREDIINAFKNMNLIENYKDYDSKLLLDKIRANHLDLLYSLSNIYKYSINKKNYFARKIETLLIFIPTISSYVASEIYENDISRIDKLKSQINSTSLDMSYKKQSAIILKSCKDMLKSTLQYSYDEMERIEIEGETKRQIKKKKCLECTIDLNKSILPKNRESLIGKKEQEPGKIVMENGLVLDFYWDEQKLEWYVVDGYGIIFDNKTYFKTYNELVEEAIERCYKKFNCD